MKIQIFKNNLQTRYLELQSRCFIINTLANKITTNTIWIEEFYGKSMKSDIFIILNMFTSFTHGSNCTILLSG